VIDDDGHADLGTAHGITPGIARTQQLAGIATGDLARQRRAEEDLIGCLSDPGQPAQLIDLTLCHGWAA
jgi:lantibiotic biosynthesis protein